MPAKLENELKRLEELCLYENNIYKQGINYIAGIDEAGRGPLAGPVVACAVILPRDAKIMYINDSKKLSEKRRNELYKIIKDISISVGIGIVSHNAIDKINILQATYQAMRIAIENLTTEPEWLLNDAVTIPGVKIAQTPIIKGDSKSMSIAAASIIAKVTRDEIMYGFHEKYPEYGFDKHKGYGTKNHIDAIKKYGLCQIHRRSFVRNITVDVNLNEDK